MKTYLILAVMPALLAACGKSAVVATTEPVVVQTSVATKTPASKEQKMKDMTIIVYPPGTMSTATSHPLPPPPSGHLPMPPAKQ